MINIKNSLLLIIILVFTQCIKDQKETLMWSVESNKYNSPQILTESISKDSINLELMGLVSCRDLKDIILKGGEGNLNDSTKCNIRSVNVYNLSDREISVYQVDLEDLVNGRYIQLMFTIEYGAILKEYLDVRMSLLEKDSSEDCKAKLKELINKVLSDTALYPSLPKITL